MPGKAKPVRTPSKIMADLLRCVMVTNGETVDKLAKKAHVHSNTVYADFKDPERIPQGRLWLYFTVLDADSSMDAVFRSVSKKIAEDMIKR